MIRAASSCWLIFHGFGIATALQLLLLAYQALTEASAKHPVAALLRFLLQGALTVGLAVLAWLEARPPLSAPLDWLDQAAAAPPPPSALALARPSRAPAQPQGLAVLWDALRDALLGSPPRAPKPKPDRKEAAPKVESILAWPGISEEVTGSDFSELCALVQARCDAAADKYHFSLVVERAFRVEPRAGCETVKEMRSHKGNRQPLFHGTRPSNAKNIVDFGFRLPDRPGMFGKGIYFADSPLKSLQYAVGESGLRTILLCDVELGRTRLYQSAKKDLKPAKDLQRRWPMRMAGRSDFDSVTAGKSAVRVPEYVVYQPQQAVPRYVLLVRQAAPKLKCIRADQPGRHSTKWPGLGTLKWRPFTHKRKG